MPSSPLNPAAKSVVCVAPSTHINPSKGKFRFSRWGDFPLLQQILLQETGKFIKLIIK